MNYKLEKWLDNILKTERYTLTPLPGDASFRQYYRVSTTTNSWMAMHSPSLAEPIYPFIAIAKSWHAQGLLVPEIIHLNLEYGFILMTDFGDALLQDRLQTSNAARFYKQALQALPLIQRANQIEGYTYPYFDEQHIQTELSYFKEWFLLRLLNLNLTTAEDKLLNSVFERLIESCITQPQTVIHRDYHSRNLMVTADDTLGIIDFQDAMIGPVTYDAVSLLKDCYIDWPLNSTYDWLQDFFYQCSDIGSLLACPFEQVKDWFDKVGLQRHLKVLGIFSRLKLRDGKSRYLCDIPRIIRYVLQVTQQYPEFNRFELWLTMSIVPKLQEILMNEGLSDPMPLFKQVGSG